MEHATIDEATSAKRKNFFIQFSDFPLPLEINRVINTESVGQLAWFQLIGPRNCLGIEISNSPRWYRTPRRVWIQVRKSAHSHSVMNFLGSSARIKLNTFRVSHMCHKCNKYFSINIAKVPLSAGCCLMTTFDGTKVNKKTTLSSCLFLSLNLPYHLSELKLLKAREWGLGSMISRAV